MAAGTLAWGRRSAGAVTWSFRVLVLAGPALAFCLARGICRALADWHHDEELHGRETGRIVMNAQGGYTEIREPAHRAAPPSADEPGLAATGHPAQRKPDSLAVPMHGAQRGSHDRP
jgi:ubiquinol-cytochrome c reductase cytochrome b subunit